MTPLDLILPPLVAAADRIRGGGLADRGIRLPLRGATLLHGWALALCLGHGFDAAGLWLVAALTLGESLGWGRPLGWALYGGRAIYGTPHGEREAYEIGWIGDNPWRSLAVRGLIWALPAAPVAWAYDPAIGHLLWIMPAAMMAAPWIAKQTPRLSVRWFRGLWPAQEVYRGALTGGLIVWVV